MEKIMDFGEKIGGAKKDLWAHRNFTIEDLNSLTDREADKFVTKDNVWKKPDYKKLVDEGLSSEAAYFRKKIRDSLPAKIKSIGNEAKDKFAREKYIEFIGSVREAVEKITTEKQLKSFFDDFIVKNGYYARSSMVNGTWTEKAYSLGTILSNKFIKAIQIRDRDITKAKLEIEKTGFPNKEEAWKKNIKIEYFKDKEWCILKKVRNSTYEILKESFESRKAAEEYAAKDLKDELRNNNKRIKLERPQLKYINREGVDYRKGRDVTSEELMKTFGFRGGEFGNWTNQDDRQAYLNYAYDAFMDLSKVLNIDKKAISFYGEMGIAFGARGSGRASAHYEPSKIVINLTKMKGAGCLAHEWAHALDDYYGRLSGDKKADNPFLSSGINSRTSKLKEETQESFKSTLSSINEKYKDEETIRKELLNGINRTDKCLDSWLSPIYREFSNEQNYGRKVRRAATDKEIIIIEEHIKNIKNNLEPDEHFNKLNVLHKEIKGFSINKKDKESIENNIFWLKKYYSDLDNIYNLKIKGNTDFYKCAEKLDGSSKKPYFSNQQELLARSFEAYISDKLNDQGVVSQYLVHSASNKYYAEEFKLYPEGAEREVINKEFDKLRDNLKELRIEQDIHCSIDENKEEVEIAQKHKNKIVEAANEKCKSKETEKDDTTKLLNATEGIENNNGVKTAVKELENEHKGDNKYYKKEDNSTEDNTLKTLEEYGEQYIKDVNDIHAKIANLDAFKAVRSDGDYVIAAPSTKEPGKIKLTYFHNDMQFSDSQLSNMNEVAESLVEGNYVVAESIKHEYKAEGNLSFDELKKFEGKNFIIRVSEESLNKITTLNVKYSVIKAIDSCKLIIKEQDKKLVLETLGLRDKEVGNIEYNKFKENPGKNIYIDISKEEFKQLKNSDLTYAAFDKKESIKLIVKENQLQELCRTIDRNFQVQLGNVSYSKLKNSPGGIEYRIYSEQQLEKLNESGIKYAAFNKGSDKYNVAFKKEDLMKVKQIVSVKTKER